MGLGVRRQKEGVSFQSSLIRRWHINMRRALLLSALCACALHMHSSSATSSPHHLRVLPHNDLPSVVTWAVMDPEVMAVMMQDLNATLPNDECDRQPDRNTLKRKRRTVELRGDATLQMQFKFKVPLFKTMESSFLNLETSISKNIPIDLKAQGRSSASRLAPLLMDLEGLLHFAGINGRACVLRSICELSAEPFVQAHGLVGELLGIFVRNMVDISYEDEIQDELTSRNEIETRGSETWSRDDGDSESSRTTTRDYVKAGLMGRSGEDCRTSECPISILNILRQF